MLTFVGTTLRFNFSTPPPPTPRRAFGSHPEVVRPAPVHPFTAVGAHVSPLRENDINPGVGVCIRPFHFPRPVSRVRGAL